ncbi:MAG: PLP-dependent aminotransferase family protein [Bacteroidales bacterium]|nr:PLP-dependent aminotransferase family protein [Bacteroidales bacterium]MDD3201054.1 PLP-dependent aminotransferase family protein [Bacteroidales bacterium]
MNIDQLLSANAKSMRRSAIRDLLKVAVKPEIISFGGGFPSPETFPIEELKKIMMDIMNEQGAAALQYGSTEGDVSLRKEISKLYNDEHLNIPIENILITTASQQAIDLLSRIFIDPGDVIVCGLPSYLGALQAFWSYQCHPYGLRHNNGLEEAVNALVAAGKKPKFIYSIPDFQNPSGETMTVEERQYVVSVAEKYDLLIIEDSPYKQIRFEGESLPTMYSMCPDRVVLLGTFSKTFVPGFRLGWVVAANNIIEKLIVAKQSADLCTPIFNQMVAARYLQSGMFNKNLEKIKSLYKHKKNIMIKAFEDYMPEGVTWTNPQGGLFLFLNLPPQYDTRELFDLAIKENVAFVIGEAFHCDDSGKNTMRLNFSYASDDKIVEGVKRLAAAIQVLYKRKGN